MEYKKLLVWLVLGTIYILGFTACDQNQNKGLKVGSLTSDGQNIISSSTLNGYPLNFTVQNISQAGGAIAQPNYYGVASQNTSFSYRSDIILNGYPTYIVFQPTVYNFANSYYGIYTGSNMLTSGNIMYEAKCNTAACDTLFLNLVIFNGGAEFRQIGIKKSMTMNRILTLTESSGNYTGSYSYKTTDQVIKELSSKSSL